MTNRMMPRDEVRAMIPSLPFVPDTKELRALRVWHWRRAMAGRAAAKSYRENATKDRHAYSYGYRQAKACDRRADFHIKCVQALNDVVSGTAEADDKTMPRESLHNESV